MNQNLTCLKSKYAAIKMESTRTIRDTQIKIQEFTELKHVNYKRNYA